MKKIMMLAMAVCSMWWLPVQASDQTSFRLTSGASSL